MFKKILLIFILAIIVVAALGGLFFWYQFNHRISSSNEEVFFTIEKGKRVKEIAVDLGKRGLIKSNFWFEIYVFLDGSQAKFMAGNYLLKKNMNIKQIVDILTAGQTTPEQVITIIEGWDSQDMADYLGKKGIVTKQDFLLAVSTADSRKIIPDKNYDFLGDKPKDQGLEGFLFPDTYRIYKDSTSAQIIEKILDNFDKKLTEQMRQDIEASNLSIFDIVTLASIIEKEVRSDDDRKIASGIFHKRLKLGMALQSDVTVNYVTGKQALQPTEQDVAVDNPYNTYKYKGLPPGPICNPSLSAIKAAIYPEESSYLYFLTKPDGSTVFSKTYQEHLENKAKYLK